jgi:hypothetical protein
MDRGSWAKPHQQQTLQQLLQQTLEHPAMWKSRDPRVGSPYLATAAAIPTAAQGLCCLFTLYRQADSISSGSSWGKAEARWAHSWAAITTNIPASSSSQQQATSCTVLHLSLTACMSACHVDPRLAYQQQQHQPLQHVHGPGVGLLLMRSTAQRLPWHWVVQQPYVFSVLSSDHNQAMHSYSHAGLVPAWPGPWAAPLHRSAGVGVC